jgi:circadian clock protein KaiC
MCRDVTDFHPAAVVIHPMSDLLGAGATGNLHWMVLRLVDFLKANCVMALFTNLGVVSGEGAATEIQIPSGMDTWLLLYNRESGGEHNRQLYLLKSRGMAHSNQVREFLMSSDVIKLLEACLGRKAC